MREDKSQLNKNNTGLHAAMRGEALFKCNAELIFEIQASSWKHLTKEQLFLHLWVFLAAVSELSVKSQDVR